MNNIQTGIEYYKAGNKTTARNVFLEVVKKEPNNEIAWMWLAACVNTSKQKKDCFHKVLAINPDNSAAQKALAELEFQTTVNAHEHKQQPVSKTGSVLKCPSCGSTMGKPSHTGIIQCNYCGTTITYHPSVENTERKNIERFLEMCKTAFTGSNYDDMLLYANKVLEIDPENFTAWVYKAIGTFWQTTVANNRYEEALEYLNKAEIFEKDNPWLQETRDSLRNSQVQWFMHLGDEEIQHGWKIYNIYATQYDLASAITDAAFGSPDAKDNSREYFIKAMDYFLLASLYAPTHYSVLARIRKLSRETSWINWSSAVKNKVALLYRIEQKENAKRELPNLRKQLQMETTKLAKLKKEKGIFTGMKIDSATKKIKSLQQKISQYEKVSKVEISP